jgi:hypothetical protein
MIQELFRKNSDLILELHHKRCKCFVLRQSLPYKKRLKKPCSILAGRRREGGAKSDEAISVIFFRCKVTDLIGLSENSARPPNLWQAFEDLLSLLGLVISLAAGLANLLLNF